MKTRILIAAILSLAIVLLALYRAFTLSREEVVPHESGRRTEVSIRIPKGSWSYEPDVIRVGEGDRFTVTIVNDDDIPHGFAIDTYGVDESIPPHESRTTRELLAKKNGVFMFYCSLMCGEGEYAGKTRGHFDMEGTLVVSERSPISSERSP
jgi:plastocyanin